MPRWRYLVFLGGLFWLGCTLSTAAQTTIELPKEATPVPTEYSTDESLVSYVSNRLVLPSGLILSKWRWTPKARELGMADYPRVGIVAQEVAALYPDATYKDENNHLVIDLNALIETDPAVAELVEICGALKICQKYRTRLVTIRQN